MLDAAPDVEAAHPGQTIIGDKNYYGREFENDLAERHLQLLRPSRFYSNICSHMVEQNLARLRRPGAERAAE
jgi:hypothetical protein